MKLSPSKQWRGTGRVEVQLYSFSTSVPELGQWLNSHPGTETQYPLTRRMDGTQGSNGRSTEDKNFLPLKRFEGALGFMHSQKRVKKMIIHRTRLHNIKPSSNYMYHQFNIHKFYVLSTQCIYVFCVDLRTNSDYFPMQH